MSQLPPDSSSSPSEPKEGIRQQADNTSMSGGMQAAQGDRNLQVQGGSSQFIQYFISLFPAQISSRYKRYFYILLATLSFSSAIITYKLIATMISLSDSDTKVVNVTQTKPIEFQTGCVYSHLGMSQINPYKTSKLSVNLYGGSLGNNVVDIMLRNIGEKVTILKKARFQVLKIENVNCIVQNFGALTVSSSYKVRLPEPLERKPPYTLDVDISQYIEPNKAERINFDFGESSKGYRYLIRVTLIADEDNKEIKLPEDIVLVR